MAQNTSTNILKSIKIDLKVALAAARVAQDLACGFVAENWGSSAVRMQLELQNVIEISFIVFYLPLCFAIINLHLSNHSAPQDWKRVSSPFKCKFSSKRSAWILLKYPIY